MFEVSWSQPSLPDNPQSEEYRRLVRLQRKRNMRNPKGSPPMQQTRQFPVGNNANQPSRSIDKTQQQMPAREQFDGRQSHSVHVRSGTGQSETQPHGPETRHTSKRDNNEINVNMNDEGSISQGPIIFGGGQMPFFGPPMPFMGMGEMSQGGPGFFPQGIPGPLGLGMPSMQSFGMMPMFPGMMPIMNPVPAGMAPIVPPIQVCSDPTCKSQSGLTTKTLVLCGGVLYFTPCDIFVFCALLLKTDDSSNHDQQPTSTSPSTIPIPTGIPKATTARALIVSTTHKFRSPEGEDYPQVSCLEGESWNLEVHECVPIKYDKEIETDYTHLPGSPWSGVTRRPIKNHRHKKRKKLVIITDKGNITYIKAA